MADTVTLDPGSGGAVIATDDLGATGHAQWVKLRDGTDGGTQTIASGGGTEAASLRVTVASDSTGVLSVDDNGASLTVDVGTALPAGTNNIGDVDVLTLPALPAGTNNIGDVDIASALPAGTNAIGKLAANSGVDIGDVDVTSIAAGSNAIGNVGVIPRTSGGLTIATDIDLDETETEIKATAGQLFGWYIYNDGAAEVYVKLYNATAATVVVGTTTPVMTLAIPPGSAANVFGEIGIAFGTAICAAATTGVATADATAPAANQVVANFFYA